MLGREHVLDSLCGTLREGPFVWPTFAPEEAELLYQTARDEGVHLLVAHRLWERGGADDSEQIAALRERLTAALRQQVVAEEITRLELQRVLERFASAGVRTLVIKGGALAYTHYPSPALRPRVDTDILIDASSRSAAATAMARLGYQPIPVTSGDLVMHEACYASTGAGGARHVIDVHWAVSNPQVFARALPPRELLAASVPVPQLGDAARAPTAVHSLAIACVHRLAHHSHRERLIWIYDIHLIAERMADAERRAFVALAAEKQLSAVCTNGLAAAEHCLGGEGASRLLAEMRGRAAVAWEPSAIFAERRMRKLDVLRSDLAALQGWRAKRKLLGEHLFPPPAYMRERYGIRTPALLPFSYAWRIVRGGAGWLWPAAAARDDEE